MIEQKIPNLKRKEQLHKVIQNIVTKRMDLKTMEKLPV